MKEGLDALLGSDLVATGGLIELELLAGTVDERVNPIGEHTDYNDGFVLPIAIDREVASAARPAPGVETSLGFSSTGRPQYRRADP